MNIRPIALTAALLPLVVYGAVALVQSNEPSKVCVSEADLRSFLKEREVRAFKLGIEFTWKFIYKVCAEKGEATLIYKEKGIVKRQTIVCRPDKQT
jgi:hypothetical protein